MIPRMLLKYVGTPSGPVSRTRARVVQTRTRIAERRHNRHHGSIYTWFHTDMSDPVQLDLPNF